MSLHLTRSKQLVVWRLSAVFSGVYTALEYEPYPDFCHEINTDVYPVYHGSFDHRSIRLTDLFSVNYYECLVGRILRKYG